MSFRDRFPAFACWLGKKKYLLSTFPYRKNPVKWTLKKYKKKYGVSLNLENPTSFYEKMNYWKHNFYDNRQTFLADKIEVKKILSNSGYGDLCAKTYFYSDKIKDVKKWFVNNKDEYKRFVFKTSHSCGDVYIYNNGVITKKYGRKIKKVSSVFKCLDIGMHYNHYYTAFEQPYKNIKPNIFVEEYIDFNESTIEYELMMNYGELIAFKIVKDRQNKKLHSEATVDSSFNIINKEKGFDGIDKIEKPDFFDLMIKISKQFISFSPFCRCDFIVTNGKLYFCEFTFVKSGGINIYSPKEFEIGLGKKFRL